jgi:hypothetical protein
VDIASASETEDPGLNPPRVKGFRGIYISAVVYDLPTDALSVCLKREIKELVQKYVKIPTYICRYAMQFLFV